MYHVLSTGITSVILYLFSYFLFRSGFYSRNMHRRLWNIIMALIFIPAALAGIFLALQVTYKWNIPIIKTILKWHVETGIAFAFTGLFHTIWHLPYFFSRYREQESEIIKSPASAYPSSVARINLFMIGFVSSSVQILLMREMMNISGGYELIAGTFLASWLIGSAAGSYMANRSPVNDAGKINLVFGIGPVISIFLLVFLNRVFFSTGETPGFMEGMIYCLVVLLPTTFISGFAFIKMVVLIAENGTMKPGRSFATETMGGVAAGILISVAAAGILNTYQILLIVLSVFTLYLIIRGLHLTGTGRAVAIAGTATLIIILIILNPDLFFRQLLLPGIKVEKTSDTPYGNITEGSYGGEKNLYYNHHLIRWQNDLAEREENIHYAMLQHPGPKNILLISGDIISNLTEVRKYDVRSVTYVERDPELAKKYGLSENSREEFLKTEYSDALRFIRRTSQNYDVIIVNLPPPSTLMLNRYYTTEFFRSAAARLDSGGIFMCSPGTGSNYFNAESATLYSSVYNSLKAVFRNVIPIVGNKLYYVASDGHITTSVCALAESRGIKNTYVSPDFLSDDLIKMKSDELISLTDINARQNTLLFPVACFHFQNYTLTRDNQQRIPSLIILAVIFILPVLLTKRSNMLMYGSAGALAGFEIIMLLVLQSAAGSMYQLTGIIIACFMAGLAIGSGIEKPFSMLAGKWKGPALLIVFYLISGLFIGRVVNMNNIIPAIILIMILSIVPAILTGRIFRETAESGSLPGVPSVYSADMAGAALGFIVVSGIAVPLLGIKVTLFLLAALIFAGVVFGTIRDKS